MVRRLIGYAAVTAVTVYLYFMYDETVISGILVFIINCRQISEEFRPWERRGNISARELL